MDGPSTKDAPLTEVTRPATAPCNLRSTASEAPAVKAGRVAFEYIGNAVQSWLDGVRAPSLVPEHIHLRHAYG